MWMVRSHLRALIECEGHAIHVDGSLAALDSPSTSIASHGPQIFGRVAGLADPAQALPLAALSHTGGLHRLTGSQLDRDLDANSSSSPSPEQEGL